MPISSRYYRPSRKLVRRLRKRVIRRRRAAPMGALTRSLRPNKIALKRTFWLENWTFSTVTTNGFWRYYSFTLSQLPSLSEFQSLFDQLKISAIKVTFRPRYDNFSGNDTTDTTSPGVTNAPGNYMHVIVDPKSLTTPSGLYTSSNLNIFMEQGNVRTYQGLRPFSVYFKPMINQTVGAVQGMRRRAPYLLIDPASGATGAPHYGFHVFQQDVNLTGTSVQSFDVYVTYYMMAKGVK